MAALLVAGCSRRVKKDTGDSDDPSQHGSRVIATRPVATPPGFGTAGAAQSLQMTEEDSPNPAKLENDYKATTDADDRIEIIYALSGLDTEEALKALGRLFQFEPDPELKSEIISAVDDAEEQIELKLVIYATCLTPDQPDDVRQAAIDALESIVDVRAIPVWIALLNDKDAGIRETARQKIEALQSPDN